MNWNIQKKTPAESGSKFYLFAEQVSGVNEYTLECSWEQCLYILVVSKKDEKEWLYSLSIFSDDDPESITSAILNATNTEIERRLVMLDEMNLDGEAEHVDLKKIYNIITPPARTS